MAAQGNFGIRLDGITEIANVLAKAGPKALDVLERGLVQELQLVMLASQAQVPVGKTGNLKASGTIAPPVRGIDSVTITLGYGGAASVYAVYVHNSPHELHWTKPGTKSHFLSDPLQKALPALESRLAARIEAML